MSAPRGPRARRRADIAAHIRLADLRGLGRLATDATLGVADVVEAMHARIARLPGVARRSPEGRTGGVTGLVYRSVRGVTRLVGASVDGLLGIVEPRFAEAPSTPEREAVLAVLNGVWGDHLVASGNPLAIPMRLRAGGTPLTIDRDALGAAFPVPRRQLLVLVHGLCMNDLEWRRDGHDHGEALARDLGYAPLYVHYNTGRHVSTNGRELSGLLETLVRQWPTPIDRLAILGHSMGGLVARSACHHAALAGHSWLATLDRLAFLGTPHHGAPLERAGAVADLLLEISPYSAPLARLGKARSAGIKDMRHGTLLDDDRQGDAIRGPIGTHRPVPLPAGVRCCAIAASLQKRPGAPGTRVRGDGLVTVNSALGRHRDPSLDLGLADADRWIGYGMGHLDLLSSREVGERLAGWLANGGRSVAGERGRP